MLNPKAKHQNFNTLNLWLFLIVLICLQFTAFSQDIADIIEVTRIDSEVSFDGVPDEHFWQELEYPNYMQQPVFMGNPSGNARFFIGYDEGYIWVAATMHYADSVPVRSVSRKRDSLDPSNDYFMLTLDTYNDNENSMSFWTNPSGIRLDLSGFNDAEGQFPFNPSWNTFWDVKTQVDGQVWNMEMRVPWPSLRYNDTDGDVVMGLSLSWWLSSIQQTMMYPAIPKNWGEWSSFKPSKIQKVKFKGIASKKPVYLAPYVISGIQAAYEPSADGLGYDKDSKSKLNGGLDAKFTLGSAWAMDLTANTDFAQVEADDQQVNLTRFDLFFPEKRVFFQERSSVFSFNTGNFNQLFYSRRIGLDNTNNLLPILGGARVIGRVKGWDVGFLDMQTAKADQQLSTNYGVFRLRKQISDNNSYAGVMVTNRVDTDGNYSSSVGTDLIYNVFGSSYLNASVSGIVDTSTNTGIESSKLYLNLTRRGIEGFGYNLTYSRIGANFNPAMGFELRNNNNQYGNRIWYGWMNTPESRFFYNQLFVKGDYFQNISDGKFDSELLGVGWKFATKTGPSGEISFNFSGENIREEFNIYNSLIPTGQYRYNGLEFMFTSGFSRDITLTMMGYGGSFYNGKNINLVFMPVWKPNETLLMSLNYIYSNLDFSGTSNDTELHLFGWKTELTLNTKLSAALYWQYNNIGKKLNGNLRFRYNPREGVDLYIVYNDIENTNRYREVPTLPTYDSRTLIVKYIYTFVL